MLMKKLCILAFVGLFIGLSASASMAAAPANDYNFDGATHYLQCISLNKSNVQLYDGAGNPLGLAVNNKPNGRCPNSTLSFQGMEAITAPNGRTYYYNWGVGGADGQSGHIWIADMTARPSISSSARGCSGSLCNGRSAPDIILPSGAAKSYYIDPQPIPSAMRYIGPSTGRSISYDNYGLPGAPYATNYTNLSWSWVNKTGGGIVRSMMFRNEVFYPSDVATITINSVDSNGVVNGSVKAIYGSYWTGNQRLYGWTVHSHTYQGTYVPHIICRTCN